jgi:hypothetical protein
MMCLTASASHTGRGTGSRSKTPQLTCTTPVLAPGLEITDKPLGKDRPIFSGSLDQISEDVRGCAKIGASEVFFDPAFAPEGQSLDYWLSLLEQLKGMMTVS